MMRVYIMTMLVVSSLLSGCVGGSRDDSFTFRGEIPMDGALVYAP